MPPQPVLAFRCWVSRRGVAAGKRKPVIIWQESQGLMYILAHREDFVHSSLFFAFYFYILVYTQGGKKAAPDDWGPVVLHCIEKSLSYP